MEVFGLLGQHVQRRSDLPGIRPEGLRRSHLARRLMRRWAHLHGRSNPQQSRLQGVLSEAHTLAAALSTSTVPPAVAALATALAAGPTRSACVAAAAAEFRMQRQFRVG